MENLRLITYVSRFIGHSASGLESQIYEEYLNLAKHHKVIVITEEGNLNNLANIKIIVVSKISIPKIHGLFKIIMYVNATYNNRNEYDAVYIRTFSLPELIAGIFAKKFLKKPLFILIPGTWIFVSNRIKIKFLRYVFKKALEYSDNIITYSKLILPEVSQLIGKIDDSKVVIIKNAVDSSRFLPSDTNINENILFVGRVHPLKRIEDIIKSISQVKTQFPNVKVNLIGNIESKTYYYMLENLIKKLDCEQNVKFVGPVTNEQIVKHYQNSQIFVFMGKNEGIPRSILEAMACGNAVIAAPNSGIPDVISDFKNGLLVKNGDHELLAKRIIELLRDTELRKRLGDNARKTIESEHNWSNFITCLSQQFQKIQIH
jgi:glycosyltransferase involved in cell wall biosynthesis